MSTLLEIEAATESLSLEQKKELVRYLTARLRPIDALAGANLIKGPKGTLLLEAPPEAPPMTTETVRHLLEEFP